MSGQSARIMSHLRTGQKNTGREILFIKSYYGLDEWNTIKLCIHREYVRLQEQQTILRDAGVDII